MGKLRSKKTRKEKTSETTHGKSAHNHGPIRRSLWQKVIGDCGWAYHIPGWILRVFTWKRGSEKLQHLRVTPPLSVLFQAWFLPNPTIRRSFQLGFFALSENGVYRNPIYSSDAPGELNIYNKKKAKKRGEKNLSGKLLILLFCVFLDSGNF